MPRAVEPGNSSCRLQNVAVRASLGLRPRRKKPRWLVKQGRSVEAFRLLDQGAGEFATVIVELTTLPGAVVVPAGALQTGQQGDYVFVVGPDMRVAMRPVVVGPRLDDRAAIDSGVQAGEQVVTDGQLRLAPGVAVVAKNGTGGAEAAQR